MMHSLIKGAEIYSFYHIFEGWKLQPRFYVAYLQYDNQVSI